MSGSVLLALAQALQRFSAASVLFRVAAPALFAVQEFGAESVSAPVAVWKMFVARGSVMALASTESSAAALESLSAESTALASVSAQTLISAPESATALAAFADTSFSAEALPTATVTELSEVAVFLFGLESFAAVSALASAMACVRDCSAFGQTRSGQYRTP